MKVFVWNYISELTINYHSDGGLVVVAESLSDAIKAAEKLGVVFGVDEREPTNTYETGSQHEPEVFIFPNAGCC